MSHRRVCRTLATVICLWGGSHGFVVPRPRATCPLPPLPPPPPHHPLSPPPRVLLSTRRASSPLDLVVGNLPLSPQDSAQVLDTLGALEWFRYSFMLPVSLLVAFLANTAGIGGAALFAPIFLLLFPLLDQWRLAGDHLAGGDPTRYYALSSPAAAVGTAIAVEFFGFSSGLVGYSRRGLVDASAAAPLVAVAMPCALIGASAVTLVPLSWLKGCYAVFMIITGVRLLLASFSSSSYSSSSDPLPLPAATTTTTTTTQTSTNTMTGLVEREVVDSRGTRYTYEVPALTAGRLATVGAGGFLTGLLGVGVGEVVLPLLLNSGGGREGGGGDRVVEDGNGYSERDIQEPRTPPPPPSPPAAAAAVSAGGGLPIPIAAGTSVLVVISSVAAAASRQWGQLIDDAQTTMAATAAPAATATTTTTTTTMATMTTSTEAVTAAAALAAVVPWNLVVWQIPGVIVGAQLAAWFNQNSAAEQATVERIVGSVFCTVGAAFAVIFVTS